MSDVHVSKESEIIKYRKTKKRMNQEKLLDKLEKKHRLESEVSPSSALEGVVSSGREYTVSVAISGSILDNAQSPELRSYLGGQIGRALAVFNIDEVIVFEDRPRKEEEKASKEEEEEGPSTGPSSSSLVRGAPLQLARILQFLECPQYLRKHFFPLHKDLQYSGILNPTDMPHHLRANQVDSPYREGIVLDRPVKEGKGSLAFIGFDQDCIIDKKVPPGVRVTVALEGKRSLNGLWKGTAVSPHVPRTKSGLYWGYNVRIAHSFLGVFRDCPYKGGSYDVILGTSERGSQIDDYELPPKFKHLLIVLGGVKGLEFAFESEAKESEVDSVDELFDAYLNTCPNQGSRTIRTEEALLITLSALRPKISASWRAREA